MASSRQITPSTRPWPAGQPSVTAVLIALLAATGSAEWFFTLLDRGETVQQGAITQWLGLSANSLADGYWWQCFTFMFLHLGPFPLHLAANLLGLYFAGREVEPILGAKHFLGLFFLGNLYGGFVHWMGSLAGWVPADLPLVGISAGVVAVIVAFATILPHLEIEARLFFVFPVQMRAKHLGLAIVLLSAALWASGLAMELGPDAMLGGAFMGWFYVKQLGYGSPFALQRYLFQRRQRAARLARMSAEQFICEEIDPILDKIAQHGMHSLTRAERRILERGREKITGKPAVQG